MQNGRLFTQHVTLAMMEIALPAPVARERRRLLQREQIEEVASLCEEKWTLSPIRNRFLTEITRVLDKYNIVPLDLDDIRAGDFKIVFGTRRYSASGAPQVCRIQQRKYAEPLPDSPSILRPNETIFTEHFAVEIIEMAYPPCLDTAELVASRLKREYINADDIVQKNVGYQRKIMPNGTVLWQPITFDPLVRPTKLDIHQEDLGPPRLELWQITSEDAPDVFVLEHRADRRTQFISWDETKGWTPDLLPLEIFYGMGTPDKYGAWFCGKYYLTSDGHLPDREVEFIARQLVTQGAALPGDTARPFTSADIFDAFGRAPKRPYFADSALQPMQKPPAFATRVYDLSP